MVNTLMKLVYIVCMCAWSQCLANGASMGEGRSSSTNTKWSGRAQQSPEASRTTRSGPTSCIRLVNKCKTKRVCLDALTHLKAKCTVKVGSCNAHVTNLADCANIMDTVMGNFFNQDQKCTCSRKSERCAKIHQTIYDNPCFASVRILRKMNMLPQFDKVRTTVNPLKSEQNTEPNIHDVINELFGSPSTEELITSTSTALPTSTLGTELSENILKSNDTTRVSTEHARNVSSSSSHSKKIAEAARIVSAGSGDRLRTATQINFGDLIEQVTTTTQPTATNQTVLLHIVAITTGVLVLIFVIGAIGLLLYFGLWRNSEHLKKNISMS